MRAGLTPAPGGAWKEPVKGMAEIAGRPGGAVDEFSQRRRQVETYLDESGARGWRAGQVAALETRDRKADVDLQLLRCDWAARGAEHGLDEGSRQGVLNQTSWAPLSSSVGRDVAAELLSREGL